MKDKRKPDIEGSDMISLNKYAIVIMQYLNLVPREGHNMDDCVDSLKKEAAGMLRDVYSDDEKVRDLVTRDEDSALKLIMGCFAKFAEKMVQPGFEASLNATSSTKLVNADPATSEQSGEADIQVLNRLNIQRSSSHSDVVSGISGISGSSGAPSGYVLGKGETTHEARRAYLKKMGPFFEQNHDIPRWSADVKGDTSHGKSVESRCHEDLRGKFVRLCHEYTLATFPDYSDFCSLTSAKKSVTSKEMIGDMTLHKARWLRDFVEE